MGQQEVSASAYLTEARAVLDRVIAETETAVTKAADMLFEALTANGVVQAFGTGHSEGLAMEIAGRAGGMVPTNKIALRDLVTLGGEPPQTLANPHLERDPEVAHRLYALNAPHAEDIFVIASNSGGNGTIVEMALLAKEKGHRLIAVTSMQHSSAVASRHPSGKHLSDLADLVLDNGAPYGDSLLPSASGAAVCAISSISGAFLVQLTVAEVIRRFDRTGQVPPVYLSANIPGGDEHNRALEQRYAGRIRRTA